MRSLVIYGRYFMRLNAIIYQSSAPGACFHIPYIILYFYLYDICHDQGFLK